MGDPIGPGVCGGDVRAADHELEVHRAAGVGADHPAVRPMIEIVAHALAARRGDGGIAGRVRCRDQPGLAGFLILGSDDDVALVGGGAEAQKHALVGLLIDQHVLAATRGAPEDLGRTRVLVAPDPEQPLRVGRERERPRRVGRSVGESLAGFQVTHDDAVIFRSVIVFGIGIKRMVWRMPRGIDGIVGFPLRLRLLVEQYLLARRHAARTTDMAGMLRAGFIAAVILERPVRRRNGRVVFLDPPFHFLEQTLLQRLRRREHVGAVGVLSHEVVAYFGAQHRGVAQDRLPILVLHPSIVVGTHPAELFDANGGFLRGRRPNRGRHECHA